MWNSSAISAAVPTTIEALTDAATTRCRSVGGRSPDGLRPVRSATISTSSWPAALNCATSAGVTARSGERPDTSTPTSTDSCASDRFAALRHHAQEQLDHRLGGDPRGERHDALTVEPETILLEGALDLLDPLQLADPARDGIVARPVLVDAVAAAVVRREARGIGRRQGSGAVVRAE